MAHGRDRCERCHRQCPRRFCFRFSHVSNGSHRRRGQLHRRQQRYHFDDGLQGNHRNLPENPVSLDQDHGWRFNRDVVGSRCGGQKWVFRTQTSNGPIDGNMRVEVNGGYNVGMAIVNDDQWHHVVATFADDGTPDALDVLLYVDGAADASSVSLTQPINTASSWDVRIGAGNQLFNGDIDEARISSVVRSADWIKACYDNQKLGSTFARYTDVHVPQGMLLIVR